MAQLVAETCEKHGIHDKRTTNTALQCRLKRHAHRGVWSQERGHRYIHFGDLFGPELRWLDAYTGEYGWHAGLNLVVLRLVSFHLDLHWATLEKQKPPSDAPRSLLMFEFCIISALRRFCADFTSGPKLYFTKNHKRSALT